MGILKGNAAAFELLEEKIEKSWCLINIASVPNQGKSTMKRWIIFVLLSILLGCPAVSGAADDTFDRGKDTTFTCPLFKIPFGSKSDSGSVREDRGETEARNDQRKDKETLDKKVDDAIKRAWEEK